ncbi:MAG: arsenate reductase [Pseudohongiella sp.]|nr:MAG: arsenate reductase [Pseudohongiella sp.]
MIRIYGIKNCDTIKKTLLWFKQQQIDFEFIDYKKTPPDDALVETFLKQFSVDMLINKRGTTWRKLDEGLKSDLTREQAIALMCEQSSVIKRPIIETNDKWLIGYDPDSFQQLVIA